MTTRNVRWFFSMFALGALVAWGGRVLADVWTVPGNACRVVEGAGLDYHCALPNVGPSFAYADVFEVWFDGFHQSVCGSATLNLTKVSYSGAFSQDTIWLMTGGGPFDVLMKPTNTARDPSPWDYVSADVSAGVSDSCKGQGIRTVSLWGVAVVK